MTQAVKDNLKTFGILLTILIGTAGVAFAAGNYPTREEWRESNQQTIESVGKLKDDVAAMKLEQVLLKSAIDAINRSQARTETTQNEIRKSVGELLLQNRERNGRRKTSR